MHVFRVIWLACCRSSRDDKRTRRPVSLRNRERLRPRRTTGCSDSGVYGDLRPGLSEAKAAVYPSVPGESYNRSRLSRANNKLRFRENKENPFPGIFPRENPLENAGRASESDEKPSPLLIPGIIMFDAERKLRKSTESSGKVNRDEQDRRKGNNGEATLGRGEGSGEGEDSRRLALFRGIREYFPERIDKLITRHEAGRKRCRSPRWFCTKCRPVFPVLPVPADFPIGLSERNL